MLPPEIIDGIATGQIPPPMVEQILMELMGQQGGGMPGGMPPVAHPGMPMQPMISLAYWRAMSNLEMDSEPQEVDAGPVDDGQAAETETIDEASAPPAEPEYDFLELDDDTASKYVKIVREGEEVVVPLKEALDGYNSNSVATKRFQEASALKQQAEEALRLQQAFQTSPGLTVQVLAQQAGMSVEDFLGLTPRQQQAAIESPPEPEYADPLERALAEERQARIALQERIEQREADEYLRAQVNGLKQTYQIGDDEVRAVVQTAIQMGVGPEAFPMIYQAQAYQKLQATTGAQQEYETKQAEDDARRRAAAAAAASTSVIGTGATNVTTAPPANVHMSPRDAVLAAYEQLEA